MSEVERIQDQLQRSYFEKAWHGAAVKQVLEGITAETALEKPVPSAHSIWELVLHMAAWKRYVHTTIGGEEMKVPDEVNFPAVTETSEEAWRTAIELLDDEHAKLVECVKRLGDESLDRPVTRIGVTVYQLLHGVVQHDLWHAGQIRILAK